MVEIKPRFTLENLIVAASKFDVTKRYMESGAVPEKADPHLVFKIDGKEVANAIVNLETYDIIPEGMGLGTGDPNDSSGAQRLQIGIVVTVMARANDMEFSGPSAEKPTSVVTIMYRNFIN
jgi:hypothetical protein